MSAGMIRRIASQMTPIGLLEVDKTGVVSGFRKSASTRTISRTASRGKVASFYADGSRKIDVGSLLAKVAKKYQISDDPNDYLFEALRANSVDDPNENNDNFRREEVLRFDPRYVVAATGQVGAPVYQTYIGKPHFVNHAAEDPARARGVIIDASYNDLASPFGECPTCGTDVKDASKRTASGLECANCFDLVKDEFVETLVAVDKTKDKRFAKYVEDGLFDAFSMGCSCTHTTCGVCEHLARSTREFCDHIRHKKGSLWLSKPNTDAIPVSADEVEKLLKLAGYSMPSRDQSRSLIARVLRLPDGTLIRRAHEDCWGTEYDELSAVHHPADPKALTTEMLIAKAASAAIETPSLEDETEMLAQAMTKKAETTKEVHTMEISDMTQQSKAPKQTKAAATKNAQLGVDVATTTLKVPSGSVVNVQAPSADSTSEGVQLNGPGEILGPDGMPGQSPKPGQAPGSSAFKDKPNSGTATPEEFGLANEEGEPSGVAPPGASLKQNAEISAEVDEGDEYVMKESEKDSDDDEPMEHEAEHDDGEDKEAMCSTPKKTPKKASGPTEPFADIYSNFEAEASADHVSVYDANGKLVFKAKLAKKASTNEAKHSAALKVLDQIATNGLIRTAKKLNAEFARRMASATADAMFDHEAPEEPTKGILDGAEDDIDAKIHDKDAGSALDDAMNDIADLSLDTPDDSLEGAIDDLADSRNVNDAESSTDGAEDDTEEGRESFNVGKDDALSGAGFDHKKAMATFEANTRKLYASRMERMRTEFEEAKAEFEAEFEKRLASEREATRLRYERALKIAAKRAALNIEESPLKIAMVDSLTVPRVVGRVASRGPSVDFAGLRESLALHLTEAAWADAAQEEMEAVMSRAAELLDYDDKYLMDAERDLSKQSAVVPPVTDSPEDDDPSMHRSASAGRFNDDLVRGNFVLAPSSADEGSGTGDYDGLSEVVWSSTRIGQRVAELDDLIQRSS